MASGLATPGQDQSPLQRFAQDLQNLRLRAGSPDYRKMARHSDCAHSTLATADKGRNLPTLRTTIAYVRACGADQVEQEAWASRWHTIKAQLSQPIEPLSDQTDNLNCDAAPPGHRPESGTAVRVFSVRRRRVPWLAAITTGLVIVVGSVIVNLSRSDGAHASPPNGLSPLPSRTASVPLPSSVPVRRQGVLVMIPGRVADLDSLAPDWDEQPDPGPSTADIWFDEQDHALHGVGQNDIAVLPSGSLDGFWPCAREQNYGAKLDAPDIRPGRVLCGLTAGNRVAQLSIINVQDDASGLPELVKFGVIVWVPLHKT